MYFLFFFGVCFAQEHCVFSNSGGKIRTLDPIHADDLASRDLLGAVFDTLVEYDYTARPYTLKPSMLKQMPQANSDFTSFRFVLRSDLCFAPDKKLPKRRIKSQDVKYSLLRLADARLHSPLFWLVRDKIAGFNEFHQLSASRKTDDHTIYDLPVKGFVIHNDQEFTINLEKSDPSFLYRLALPNAAVVRREAVELHGKNFGRNPSGSGPFVLQKWINDYKVVLVRNPLYRQEFFPQAQNPADRTRPLPLADKIEISLIRQPMTSYLMFLRGDLDYQFLDKDKADAAAPGGNLSPALKKRGIHLVSFPEFEIRYVGFNFQHPLFARNKKLRAALSMAYDVARRVKFTNNQLIPVQSPLPPGVGGFDPGFRNPYARYDLETAKKLLAEAGFPDGIDPATGSPLVLTFDQSGSSSTHRQYGELAAADFAKLGIKVTSVLNNKPRFYEKLRQGKTQLFRLSWIGDYPDAENFLQLFYSGNSGACNRTRYSNAGFDRLYEELATLPDSPKRREICRKMISILASDCVWIYEGIPLSWQLKHDWLENFYPHDFGFIRWKYISVDPQKRQQMKKSFTPLSFKDLQN